MRSEWKDGERTRAVEVHREPAGHYRVTIDDAELDVTVEPLGEGRWRLTDSRQATVFEVTAAGAQRFVRMNGMDFVVERLSGARKRSSNAHAGSLEAPMPGVVTRVMAAAGDAVKKGQPLVAVEAMKMEHLVRAPRDGVIKEVRVAAGELVQGGAALIELEEPGTVA